MNSPSPSVSTPVSLLGRTGLSVPRVVFGTSALGNLYAEPPAETKIGIVRAIVQRLGDNAVLDSAGKYGAGLSLEWIGRSLRELGIAPDRICISNKLGWYRVPLKGSEPTFERGVWMNLKNDAEQRISAEGILQCYEQGNELLGAPYKPSLVSVHDPDEYLAAATSPTERAKRIEDVKGAYRSLIDLRRRGLVRGVGIGSKDWTIIRDLAEVIDFDWVMLACSFTVFTHPPELLRFMAELESRGVGIINSAVFHGGFLTGQSEYFDYRKVDPTFPADHALCAWRAQFLDLCRDHSVSPTAACVRFGLSGPGVVAIALNSSKPGRVAENVAMAYADVPEAFWSALKDAGLVDPDYPYL